MLNVKKRMGKQAGLASSRNESYQPFSTYRTALPWSLVASTWKYQKRNQSEASFPAARQVYVAFTTVSPSRKRVRSEH